MHDIGLVPQGAHGWGYALAPARHWLPGRTPFRNDRDLRASLGVERAEDLAGKALRFRYEFEVPARVLRSAAEFALELTTPLPSPDDPPGVWLNGKEVGPHPRPRQGKREYEVKKEAGWLTAGRNEVVVEVRPGGRELEVLLDLRLDEVRQPIVLPDVTGDVKTVQERATVCDLCSAQWGQRPACVTACPHDAALRVDARFEFPVS
jgi:hypothetical protein